MTLRRWWWLAVLPVGLLGFGAPQDVLIPSAKPREAPRSALFSHWRHQSQQCFNCHPTVFPQALKTMTHEQMKAGQFCGSCHDGHATQAIGTMRCEACHASN